MAQVHIPGTLIEIPQGGGGGSEEKAITSWHSSYSLPILEQNQNPTPAIEAVPLLTVFPLQRMVHPKKAWETGPAVLTLAFQYLPTLQGNISKLCN